MINHLPANHSNNFIKLRNSLISATGKAIGDYNMIEEGDSVLVCMSGGKDSHAMLMILLALQERAPINFKLIAMNLDQKQPNFPADILPAYFEKLGVDYRIVEADTYSIDVYKRQITALARLPDLNSVSCFCRYSGC